MAISDPQRRAICRIYVPGTTARGTGFLVEGRDGKIHVLTAAHVVKSKDDAKKPHAAAPPNIEVEFGNPEGAPILIEGVAVAKFAHGVDAALLQLPGAPPPGAKPLPLRVRSPGFLIPWQTHGYSDAAEVAGKLGQAYGGDISTTDAKRFQLRVDQVWGDPAGLSGSPCIVDNQVVGIILKTQTGATSETLFARCVGVLAGGLPELKFARVVSAYWRDVVPIIKGFDANLEPTAALLGAAADADEVADTTPADRLPRRVAEAMMAGMKQARRGITSLKAAFLDKEKLAVPCRPPQAASRIFDWSTRTWIDQAAVEALAQTLHAGKQIVVLNTGNAEIAEWYVHRAGCTLDNAPGLFEYHVPVAVQSIERGALLADIEPAVAARFGETPAGLAQYLESHDHDMRPIVVSLSTVPERDDLDFVMGRKAGEAGAPPEIYGKMRFILVVGPDVPDKIKTQYADAKTIEPLLVAEQATQALNERDSETLQLLRVFNPTLADIKP